MAKKTKAPKSPASPPFKMTVPLPATNKKKKKTGPAGGPKPKKKKKGIADILKRFDPGSPLQKPKKKQKLTEEQKKNVEKGATVMEKQDIPGTPHFRMVPKKSASGTEIMEAKGGGLAAATAKLKAQGLKKGGFPDLSGDGKVTMKDILMGRGVIKKPKKKAMGGSMTLTKGKLKGVKDAPEERRKEKLKRVPRGLAMGVAGAMKGSVKAMKKAGRLALRGYGKARK